MHTQRVQNKHELAPPPPPPKKPTKKKVRPREEHNRQGRVWKAAGINTWYKVESHTLRNEALWRIFARTNTPRSGVDEKSFLVKHAIYQWSKYSHK